MFGGHPDAVDVHPDHAVPVDGLVHVRWFQVVCALTPLDLRQRGMRAELVPGLLAHSDVDRVVVMIAAIGVFGAIGIKGYAPALD